MLIINTEALMFKLNIKKFYWILLNKIFNLYFSLNIIINKLAGELTI